MQCVFDSQNKRRRLFNILRNHVDHQNSVLFFYFLSRRPKFDEIGQRLKSETKRDEMRQQRSSKCHNKRPRPENQQFVRSDFCRNSFAIRVEK